MEGSGNIFLRNRPIVHLMVCRGDKSFAAVCSGNAYRRSDRFLEYVIQREILRGMLSIFFLTMYFFASGISVTIFCSSS